GVVGGAVGAGDRRGLHLSEASADRDAAVGDAAGGAEIIVLRALLRAVERRVVRRRGGVGNHRKRVAREAFDGGRLTMRYAICNETFEGWDHLRICKFIAGLGYGGVQIAPFTLAGRITEAPADKRREMKRQAEDHGVQIIGLHWLLAKTTGLMLTSPEESVRRATADYLVELARACADFGGDLMVFGSPAQRRVPEGATKEQATEGGGSTVNMGARRIGVGGVV